MAGRLPVEIAPERGYVLLGDVRVSLDARPNGILLAAGTAHLRPVTFAERGDMVLDALCADDPAVHVAGSIVQRSAIDPGDLPTGLLAALTVALAGGGEETLSFASAAWLAAEREGWSWNQILEAPAWLVDRAAAGAPDPDTDWSTIVFPSDAPADMDAMARTMSQNLLRRSIEPASPPSPRKTGRSLPERRTCADATTESPEAHREPFATGVASTAVSASHALAAPETADANSWKTAPAALPLGAGHFSGDQRSPASSRDATRERVPRGVSARSTTRSATLQQASTAHPDSPWVRDAGEAVADLPALGAMPAQIGVTYPIASIDPLPAPHHCATPGEEADALAPSDWLGRLASALSAECDLRGLDR